MPSRDITISRAALNELIRAGAQAETSLRQHGSFCRGGTGTEHEAAACGRLRRALASAKTERARANSAKAKASRKEKQTGARRG